MSSTELAPVNNERALERSSYEQTPVVAPESLQHIINIAKIMAASGFYPDAKTAQQAAALMILGQQFGLAPAQALTGIHIVKGKPMLHYSVILAKVRQHPDYDYEIRKHTDKECEIVFYRRGKECGVSTFTDQDARKQATQNMDKLPKTMLLARAASNGVKWYCPDVLNGMPVYVQGEVEEDSYHDAPTRKRDEIGAHLSAQDAIEQPVRTVDPETGEVYDGPTVRQEPQEALI